MKTPVLFAALFTAAVATFGLPAAAQHAGHGTAATAAKTELADGEIRRIDAAKGTVLIKHGELKSVNMGPMTMGFKLKDAKFADGLAVGDKVKFAVEQKGDDLIVTKIEKAK